MTTTRRQNEFETAWWVDEAIDDEVSNVMAVTAGLGSGKSHGMFQWLFFRALQHPACKYFAYSMPIYELIHNTAFRLARKVLEQFEWEENTHFRVVKSPYPKVELLPTGQEIHFLSANRPDKIKAVEYGCSAIDEPGVCKKEAIDLIRSRTRDKAVKLCQVLLGGTPEGINHYADEFDSDENPGWDKSVSRDHRLERLTKVAAGREYTTRLRRFRLTTFDNEHNLPDDYIANIMDTYRNNPAYIQSYVYGIFVPFLTGGCYNFKPQIHKLKIDVDPDPFRDILLTWDFNANGRLVWNSNQPNWSEVFGERKGVYLVVHEASEGFTNLEDAIIDFAVKHPRKLFSKTTIKLFGDRSGYSESHKARENDYTFIAKYLKRLGYESVEICALDYNPAETLSVEALNNWLDNAMLFICPRCTRLARSFQLTRWKDNTRKIDKPADDDWTDPTDAEKYLAYALQEQVMKRPKAINVI